MQAQQVLWSALQLHHSMLYNVNRTYCASQCIDVGPGLKNTECRLPLAQFDVFNLGVRLPIGLRSAQMVMRPMLAIIPRLWNMVM